MSAEDEREDWEVRDYPVEKISGGFVLSTDEDPCRRTFWKDEEELMRVMRERVKEYVNKRRHFAWDGKFTIVFGVKEDAPKK